MHNLANDPEIASEASSVEALGQTRNHRSYNRKRRTVEERDAMPKDAVRALGDVVGRAVLGEEGVEDRPAFFGDLLTGGRELLTEAPDYGQHGLQVFQTV